ncbi:hypothetical protein B296_00007347 [Ensete ventricosum]|uniref:Uncharacterized protein n=1 Tax=Ensete ventricosum TaxID=4639 RepID=A0A426ZU74_ENSVE|nr:hypothetical protein B296_00007347 [Ensete ventricosum]
MKNDDDDLRKESSNSGVQTLMLSRLDSLDRTNNEPTQLTQVNVTTIRSVTLASEIEASGRRASPTVATRAINTGWHTIPSPHTSASTNSPYDLITPEVTTKIKPSWRQKQKGTRVVRRIRCLASYGSRYSTAKWTQPMRSTARIGVVDRVCSEENGLVRFRPISQPGRRSGDLSVSLPSPAGGANYLRKNLKRYKIIQIAVPYS